MMLRLISYCTTKLCFWDDVIFLNFLPPNKVYKKYSVMLLFNVLNILSYTYSLGSHCWTQWDLCTEMCRIMWRSVLSFYFNSSEVYCRQYSMCKAIIQLLLLQEVACFVLSQPLCMTRQGILSCVPEGDKSRRRTREHPWRPHLFKCTSSLSAGNVCVLIFERGSRRAVQHIHMLSSLI